MRKNSIKIIAIIFLLFFFQILIRNIFIYWFTVPSFSVIDPWINIGYGQAWPNVAADFNYYKESRLISTIYEFLINDLDVEWRQIVNISYVSFSSIIGGIILNRIIKTYGFLNYITIIFTSLVIFTQPIIWGDPAGGFTYYNTTAIIFIFLFVYNVYKIFNDNNNLLNYTLFGALSYLLLIDSPSSLPLITITIIFVFIINNIFYKANIFNILNQIKFTLYGAFFWFILQAILLYCLEQDINRLISGPNYLIKSLINPEFLQSYQENFNVDILRQNHIYFFIFLLINYLVNFLTMIKLNFENKSNKIYKIFFINFPLIMFLTFFGLLFLEISSKSFLLRIDYHVTVFLQFGILIYCAQIIIFLKDNKLNYSFFKVNAIQNALIILFSLLNNNVLFFLYNLISLQFFTFLIVLSKKFISRLFIIMSFFIFLLLINYEYFHASKSSCEKDRNFYFKYFNNLLETTDKFGARYNQLIVLDKNMLKLNIIICKDAVPSAEFYYAFASLGFSSPGHKLGAITEKERKFLNITSYAEDRLIGIDNRQNEFVGCYFSIQMSNFQGYRNEIYLDEIYKKILFKRICS